MKLFLLVFVLIANACSCAFNKNRHQQDEEKKVTVEETTTPAIIQIDEQEKLKTSFNVKKDIKISAYCLFSYAGWADRGQHCRVKEDTAGKIKFYLLTKKNKPDAFTSADISEDEFKRIEKLNTDNSDLSSISQKALDHLQFEYVVFEKQNSDVWVKRRVVFDHPEIKAQFPKHWVFIEDFLKNIP